MRTSLVVKLIVVLVLLLGVVLYKMNDFYKQEKLSQAESLVRKQIVLAKTSVSGQIAQIKNVLSSYEIEIKENQINWVQLDPFFAIARLQKKNDGNFSVLQYVGRSGSTGERWNTAYLEKALSVRKGTSDKAIQAKLFKDRAGGKHLVLIFSHENGKATAVVGAASYFQKYFDLDRGGNSTSALMNSEGVLAAHTESDYIATISDEDKLSTKKHILAKEEIAGTNLTALSYTSKKAIAPSWMVPWSVVGLIFGFGFVLIGLLFYGLDPLEKKIERYKKQEREAAFQDMVKSEVSAQAQVSQPAVAEEITGATLGMIDKNKEESVERAQKAFAEPEGELAEATLNGPLQQALFNLDSVFRNKEITVEKEISTRVSHSFYYSQFIQAFENILRNAIEAMVEKSVNKKIIVRAYDIDETTVVEIQDNGIGLGHLKNQVEKIWQPFFTSKSKSQHMGLGLTESLSTLRRCGADLTVESLASGGVLVKMVMQREQQVEMNDIPEVTQKTNVDFSKPLQSFQEAKSVAAIEPGDDLDLDKVLALDDAEAEDMFTSQKVNMRLMGSKTAKTEIKTPQFKFEKKSYSVDEMTVTIRRPEKS